MAALKEPSPAAQVAEPDSEAAGALIGQMLDIPAGTFRMGDVAGGGNDDEKPIHSVSVRTFRMGRTEATVGQFRRFVEATGYRTDAEKNTGDNDGCLTLGSDPEFGWQTGDAKKPGRG